MATENIQIHKKEQTFRGKTIEELKKLDVREFAKLLKSKNRRSVLRNFQDHENFVKRVKDKLKKGKKSIRTHKRDLVIVPELVGTKMQVYNGREYVPFEVTLDMLGHRFGEFSPTRARAKHTNKSKTVKPASNQSGSATGAKEK